MGFLDRVPPKKEKAKSKADLTTTEGLLRKGEEAGLGLEAPKRRTGILGGLQRFAEILSTGEFAVGGLLAGKGAIEGIKQKISPSKVLMGETPEDASRAAKIFRGALGLAIDIGLDPTTYLTLGAGSALKVSTKAGTKVFLSKTGKEMLKGLATEVGEKAARQKIAQQALIKGNEKLLAKRGFKFAGIELIKPETLKKPFKFITESLKQTERGRKLVAGIDKGSQAVAKTFSRDYGLDDVAIKNKQKLFDGIDNARLDIGDQIKLIFSGTTKAQREAIPYAIEGGVDGINKLEPVLRKLALRTKDIFASLHKEEEKLGLINHWVDDYVTHLYKNKNRGQDFLRSYNLKGGPSAGLRFARKRRIPTISEAEKLGYDPIKDIAEILNVRMVASEKAKLTQEFFRTTAKTHGLSAGFLKGARAVPETLPRKLLETQEKFVRLESMAHAVPKDVRKALVPEYLARDIAKMGKRWLDDSDFKVLLNGYDKALNWFKGSVTVLFPAFHGRNAISNVLQNFLDIGAQAINPVRHKEAVKIMTEQAGDMVTELGTKYSYKNVRKMARENGVLTNRVSRLDLERSFTENPLKRNTPFGYGRTVGRGIENEARMVNFTTNLRRGFSPEDAAAKTKEFLFDYDNLSVFEKDIARRFIPFYTWTRKNLALQLKAAATQPGKQISQFKALRAMEEMIGEPKDEKEKRFAPDFVMAGMNILLNRKDSDRTFLSGFDLPIESAFDFFNKPLKEIGSSLSPIFKAPLELATGHNFFKEKAIKEDETGRVFEVYPDHVKKWLEYDEKEVTTKEGKTFKIQKVNPQKKWLLQQFEAFAGIGRFTSQGFIEPIRSVYRMLEGKEKITAEDKWNVIRFFTGLRAFTIDIEASKRAHEKNDVQELLNILERRGILGRMEIAFPSKEKKEKVPTSSRFSDIMKQ